MKTPEQIAGEIAATMTPYGLGDASSPLTKYERALVAAIEADRAQRVIADYHATRVSGTGCPDGTAGKHYFAFIDLSVDGRVCIDCGAPESPDQDQQDRSIR